MSPFCTILLYGRKSMPGAYPQQLSTLGDHLKKRRLDLGLLQKEVAMKLGVNEAPITRWELNHNFPEFRFIPKIIEFLDYCPDDTRAENLVQLIVNAHHELGLNQKNLAIRLGIDPSTLGRYKHNNGQPLM